MQSSLKYRITGMALAAVFALFNIGLPVVVASCPMMKFENLRSCMMCNDDQTSGVKLTRAIDKSCCATVFASDRNKTEFLKVAHQFFDVSKFVSSFISIGEQQSVIRNFQSVITGSASPPRSADIPMLVSSLLI